MGLLRFLRKIIVFHHYFPDLFQRSLLILVQSSDGGFVNVPGINGAFELAVRALTWWHGVLYEVETTRS